ncbi:MAG: radical SAM family heme chaperone HemW [Selenomonadaceae bacterium]|nr:radical SAM family heme chaperone HemW [Selenomonadaceae bacterium]
MSWGVYVHIPFCRRKCWYCDFVSAPGTRGQMTAYVKALQREIKIEGRRLRERGVTPPRTVYLGGGTPTALPVNLLLSVIESLREDILALTAEGEEREFTVEVNPGTVDASYLAQLKKAGVNRLSLGVQSFDDGILQNIGRIHCGEEAAEAVTLAQKLGFPEVSLDLMYALPGQSLDVLQKDVARALSLAPTHLSVYGLQVEEGTPLFQQVADGKIILPSEDEAEAMYDYLTNFLPSQGYSRYEISNFALPGHESRHNMGYWQDASYIGFGAAAHSYWQGERYQNTADVGAYIAAIPQDEPIREPEEVMTREIAMAEFCFLALRTAQGLDKERFRHKFGVSLAEVYGEVINGNKNKGLLVENENFCRLTPLGMKYGNMVFADFC